MIFPELRSPRIWDIQMALTFIKPSSQKTSTDIGAIRFQSIFVEMEDFIWWMSCVKQTEETSEYWK